MEYVGTKEAAEMLRCTKSYISVLCRNKKFPNAEQDAVGSPWRIPIKDIEQYMKRRKNL